MRSRFPFHFLPAALALAPLFGCTDLAAIGTQCPPGAAFCLDVEDVDSGRPAAADSMELDAGSQLTMRDEGGALVDAQSPTPSGDKDAGAIASTPEYPSQLRNPSFAITSAGSSPGDVVTVALPLAGAQIDPWFTCQPIGGGDNPTTAVRAEKQVTLSTDETPPFGTVESQSGIPGDPFISVRYLVALVNMPLVQRLPTPLRKGQRYVIAASIFTGNTDAELSLQLRAANSANELDLINVCINPVALTTLAESAPITSLGWQTVCLPFMPPDDYSYLGLAVKSPMLTAARLFVDNLRAPNPGECPDL